MRAAPLLALLVALPLPNAARAAGFYVGDTGARGLARGGAFVAAPDSLLALHYNPAALTLLGPGLHLQIDVVTVSLAYEYTRACPCVASDVAGAADLDRRLAAGFAPTQNSAAPQPVPALNVAYQLPWHKLTLGIGLWAGLSPGRAQFGDFEIDNDAAAPFGDPAAPTPASEALQRQLAQLPHRYNLLELHLFEAYYAGAVALEPIEGLRVGVVLGAYQFYAQQTVSLWANTNLTADPEDRRFDIPVLLDFAAPLRPLIAGGVSYTPSFLPQLSVGASFLGKRSARAEGSLKLGVPSLITQAGGSITGDSVEVELNLPPIFRFGLQWAEPQLFTLEAAVVIEGWGVYQEVVVRPRNVVVTLSGTTEALEKIRLKTGLEDTVAIRVGGEWNKWSPYVSLRAGYFFEPTAVPVALQDISTPDLDKHGFTLGAATTWGGVTLEAVGAYVLMPELVVTDSERRMVGPLQPPQGDNTLLTTTGNGSYSGSYFMVGASLGVSFDALADALGDDEAAPRAPAVEKGLASPGAEG